MAKSSGGTKRSSSKNPKGQGSDIKLQKAKEWAETQSWHGLKGFIDSNAVFSHRYNEEVSKQIKIVSNKNTDNNNTSKTIEVSFKDIYPYQEAQMKHKIIEETLDSVYKNGIINPLKGVKIDGKVYITDGHHRATAAILLGVKKVKVNIIHEYTKKEFDKILKS